MIPVEPIAEVKIDPKLGQVKRVVAVERTPTPKQKLPNYTPEQYEDFTRKYNIKPLTKESR